MTVKRALAILLLACLAVPAATGIAAFEDDDYCTTTQGLAARGDPREERSLLPPGRSCVFPQPGGTTVSVGVGSTGEFLIAFAGALVVIVMVALRWPRVPVSLRLIAAGSAAIAMTGLGALGDGQFGIVTGLFVGIPLACGIDFALARRSGQGTRVVELMLATTLAVLALFLGGFLWAFFGVNAAAAFVSGAIIAGMLAWLVGRRPAFAAAG